MRLSREDIESVASLSKLELSEKEIDRFMGHINDLLEHFERLQELDTADIEPTSHVIPVFNVFRKDESRPSLPPEEVVVNGPDVEDASFVVPRVVD